jgi:tetratricopeptide (TPR) repeat protein
MAAQEGGRMKGMGMLGSMVTGLASVMLLAQSGAAADPQVQTAAGRKLAPLTWGNPPLETTDKLTTEAARALIAGKPELALERADAAIKATPHSAWAHYQKASALAALRRWDDAVKSYDEALRSFARPDDWGRSVALWGRSEALREAGHCDEAKSSFNEYVALVASRDAKAAGQANAQAAACATSNERAAAMEPASEQPAAVTAAKPEEAATGKPTPAGVEPASPGAGSARSLAVPLLRKP